MNKTGIERAKELADEYGIDAEFIVHEQTGRTTEDAGKALGISVNDILKTLILYDSRNDRYIGVIILGSDRLDFKKLARISDSRKLRFASDEQIEKLTSFAIGGIPPIGIKFCSNSYMDRNVYEKAFVIGAGGDEFCGMQFNPKQLLDKLDVELVEVTTCP